MYLLDGLVVCTWNMRSVFVSRRGLSSLLRNLCTRVILTFLVFTLIRSTVILVFTRDSLYVLFDIRVVDIYVSVVGCDPHVFWRDIEPTIEVVAASAKVVLQLAPYWTR